MSTNLSVYSLIIFLFLSTYIFSQNYKPFSVGTTYQYVLVDSPKKEIASFRIDSARQLSNGDSAFFFNHRVFKSLYDINKDSLQNIFGKVMTSKPNGEYEFITVWKDTFLIKTKDTAWVFDKKRNINAKSSIKFITLGGIISDSILTIQLSNGKSLIIGKNSGLLEGTSFVYRADDNFDNGTNASVKFENIKSQLLFGEYNTPVGLANTLKLSTGDILGYHVILDNSHWDFSTNSYMNLRFERLLKVVVKAAFCLTNTNNCGYNVEVIQKNIDNKGVETLTNYKDMLYVNSIGQIKGKFYSQISIVDEFKANDLIEKKYLTGEIKYQSTSNYTYLSNGCKGVGIPEIKFFDAKNFIDKGQYSYETYKYPAGLSESGISRNSWSVTFPAQSDYASLVYYKIGNQEYGDSTIIFKRILSIDNEETNNYEVVVFPNPAENELIIIAKQFDYIRIFDMTGREILKTTKDKMDISWFHPGLYNINVYSKNGIYRLNIVKK